MSFTRLANRLLALGIVCAGASGCATPGSTDRPPAPPGTRQTPHSAPATRPESKAKSVPEPIPTPAASSPQVAPQDAPATSEPQAPSPPSKTKDPQPQKKPKPVAGTASQDVSKAKSLAPQEGLPPLLSRIEKQYERVGTLVADFRQIISSASGSLNKKPKESSGVIKIQYPDRFRWETLKPDATLVVSDGNTFWQYTPPFDSSEPGQLIEGSARRFRNTLAGALLAGNFSRLIPIRELSDSRFQISPKRGTAGSVTQVEFSVDPKQLVMTSIQITHSDGTVTEIVLSEIRPGAAVDTTEFHFVAPPNTDRLPAQ